MLGIGRAEVGDQGIDLRPIRTEDEGNAFAALGIDCGPGGEAGLSTMFGPGSGLATPEEAARAQLDVISDLVKSADRSRIVLVTSETDAVTAREIRTYAVPDINGVPVVSITVRAGADGTWSVAGSANCVEPAEAGDDQPRSS
jgi:hypothetical protein